MRKKFVAALLGGMLTFGQGILNPSPIHAEIRTIEADGEYTMGDGLEENRGTAKERARKNAVRVAGEQACLFVESLSEVKNGKLTRDEIRTVSAAVLEVINSAISLVPSGESIKFVCHITVTVDTDSVMIEINKGRDKLDAQVRRIKELEEENDRIRAENERIKNEYKTTNGIAEATWRIVSRQGHVLMHNGKRLDTPAENLQQLRLSKQLQESD